MSAFDVPVVQAFRLDLSDHAYPQETLHKLQHSNCSRGRVRLLLSALQPALSYWTVHSMNGVDMLCTLGFCVVE